jgi:polyphosphate kinase
VQVDLLVRDSCRLRPGIQGLSESVRVISLVGRFLEHARVYYFKNEGAEEYYIGSADCMRRNLQSRVELFAPVEDPELQAELRFLLDTQLADQRSGWEMQTDGSYVKRGWPDAKDTKGSHDRLIARAEKRLKAAMRLRRRRPRSIG